MNATMPTTFAPPPGFVDPRLGRTFQPAAWPLCNGKPAPLPGTSDLHERRCLEFLAAYYRINQRQRQLLAARRRSAPRSRLRSLQAALRRATGTLEALEDRYAAVGFFGEPALDGPFVVDVQFVRPELPRLYPQPASHSSHIAIPVLEGIPASELRGPARVIRFRHGKMDV